jgi:hypothetical protein
LIRDLYLIKEGGNRGKYILTEKAFNYPAVGGFLFGQKALIEIMNWQRKSITINNKLWNRELINRIIKSRVEPERKNSGEEQGEQNLEFYKFILFEFANRIGAYITYSMIQALNPHRSTKNIDLTGSQKNALVRDWLDNTISGQSILEEFEKISIVRKALIKPTYEIHPEYMSNVSRNGTSDVKWVPRSDDNWSPHDTDANGFKNLFSAFNELYPGISERFQNIMSESIEEIDDHEKYHQNIK